jgi:hypothetical protein
MSKPGNFHKLLEAAGIPIKGVSGDAADCTIHFAGATKEQEDLALSLRQAFPWAAPEPNPEAAQLAILGDEKIAAAAKCELIKYKPLLDSYTNNPEAIKQAWALIRAADAAIDSNSADAVEAHCAAAGMPLE